MRDLFWKMPPNQKKALWLARRQLPELVCDAVNLEGIAFSLPEIQTLLDGITVGGRKIADQQIALNQAEAWKTLFQWVSRGEFDLSAEKVCQLHGIAAREEALKWGCFRDGQVLISGTHYTPPLHSELAKLFDEMKTCYWKCNDIYEASISVFLTMSRYQFFFDVNKRMGRFIMNGLLLNAGFPVINVPASHQIEFNTLMLQFYNSADQSEMRDFMRRCLPEKVVEIMKE